MLQLKHIVKSYITDTRDAATAVTALRGIDLAFRDSEFVSVLGPSGCGKTTLLNILGGLDRYTSGDLVINGRSTKEYRDADWDTYRNHSIGFVFQSYNLIPHQSVLANVELALTLSGVSRAERRRRATEALEKVGLGDQLHKKPNQMSGGQMQRVAIARALVNDPDILLADEPTGALDTATSVQIMELLKEISQNKLILMVTHNPELAERYSSRIVRLLDGQVVGDTMPYDPEQAEQDAARYREKPAVRSSRTRRTHKNDGTGKGKRSMSFLTALSLSFQNLMTKKARTLLTSFAGSIGIIGIALILALSTGVQSYIDNVQRDTLTSYPITIEAEATDLSSLFAAMAESGEKKDIDHDKDAVYSNSQMYTLFNSFFAAETKTNNLGAFRSFLKNQTDPSTATTDLLSLISTIQYQYDVNLNVYLPREDGTFQSCSVSEALKDYATSSGNSSGMYQMISQQVKMLKLWTELLPGKDGALLSDLYREQYDLIAGAWPENENDIVLILDENNEISDFAFYALGLIPDEEVTEMMASALRGEKIDIKTRSLDYDSVCGTTFRLLPDAAFYTDADGDGIFTDSRDDKAMVKLLLGNARQLRISGIIRPNADAVLGSQTAAFGYTSALIQALIKEIDQSPVVVAQKDPENQNLDVLTGLPFEMTNELNPSDAEKADAVRKYFASLSDKEKTDLYRKMLARPSEEELRQALDEAMTPYSTREAMEELAAATYGMSVESIRSYLASYTDEQLHDMIEEQVRELLLTQYEQAAEEQIKAIMTTPSDQELEMLTNQILSAIPDRQSRIFYVMQDWKQQVSMDDSAILQYLSALSDEALDAAAVSVATKTARELYTSHASTDSDAAYAKVALLFDSIWKEETDQTVLAEYYDSWMPSGTSGSTLAENLKTIGAVSEDAPSAINIYAVTFEDKDAIANIIQEYNRGVSEEDEISYTDYVALLMSGVTSIINAISYGLIAFVAISLVVSSIMIGIITYISVLERTKEIGILRAIGASKRDISLVFNAETLLVGFTAGALGILISLLLCFPINLIIHHLSGIDAIRAFLPVPACVILVLISMGLTLIAGLLPSGMAARKDPVEALRTE